ncbi:hypothetical protein [Ruegeria halocynthiae]|uniref:hypothetical protein n=1 Tax=Ruegeria halocynthiae TaxID=985054 RepID=UPI000569DAC2|nr:hypothetical protein [Ruegeria halocynthiae]
MQNKYLYRIYRLRRLAATSLIILFTGWLAGEVLFGQAVLLSSTITQAVVTIACLTIAIGLIVVYPRVWWETVCAALVLGLLLMFLPLLETLPEYMPRDEGVMAVLWTLFIVVFGAIFLWLGLYLTMFVLFAIPSLTMRDKSRVSVPLSAEKAFEILRVKPDSDDGFHATGCVDADGFFTTSFEMNTFESGTYLPITEVMTVRTRIEEEGECFQLTMFGYEIEGDIRYDLQELKVEQEKGRSVCTTVTQKSESNLFESIGFWMQDFGSDHLLSHLMTTQGAKSVCIRDMPYRSPMYDLARYFESRKGDYGSHNHG